MIKPLLSRTSCETLIGVHRLHDGAVKSGKFKDAEVMDEFNQDQTSVDPVQIRWTNG